MTPKPHWLDGLSAYDRKHLGAFREWAMAENSSPYAAWEIRRAEARSLFEQYEVAERARKLLIRENDQMGVTLDGLREQLELKREHKIQLMREVAQLKEQVEALRAVADHHIAEAERSERHAEERDQYAQQLQEQLETLRQGLESLKGAETSGVGANECTRVISYRALNERIEAILESNPASVPNQESERP